ncbi:MAG: Type 1 glutamine amidotransferase-like domain-containing protein [Pseudomonadota bacterium]
MGKIVLMGSGELTATMVEVHKKILAGLPERPNAVFLDTPAGFQQNVDEISRKAVDYFRKHVQQTLTVASYKSSESATDFEAETAFHLLRNANFVLVGPGSPTYTVRQLQETPVPVIFNKMIQSGGCMVSASAAALTMGRYTLPVYEIYKVGQAIHWVDGLDILSSFGFNLVVVPHWNNAEGGTHDTRFCFMGETRFQRLEALLPDNVKILGIDEHTACIIDLETRQMDIEGIGGVTVREMGREIKFGKGEQVPLEALVEGLGKRDWKPRETDEDAQIKDSGESKTDLLGKVHSIESSFQRGMEKHDPKEMTSALLKLDNTIWQAQKELDNEENISEAREILRDLIVLLGAKSAPSTRNIEAVLAPLVDRLLELRTRFRKEEKWPEADHIRDILQQANILVEDTDEGFRWRIMDESPNILNC